MSEVKTSQVTTTVQVVDILAGEIPAIITVKRAVNPSGVARHFTLKTPVLDRELFQRLLSQVQKGDEITATIVNEWRETGRVSYLADFALPLSERPLPQALALSGTR